MTAKQLFVNQNRRLILYLLSIFALSFATGCYTANLPLVEPEAEVEPAVESVVETAIATPTKVLAPTLVQPTDTPEPSPTVAVALSEPKLVMFWSAY